jgi:hypothetical protein
MVVDRPNNGRSSLLLRNLTTGSLVANRLLRPGQVPLAWTALGTALYGTGLGTGDQGFVERFGPGGVIWRTNLPQPALIAPVSLPNGSIAVQSEDPQCGLTI